MNYIKIINWFWEEVPYMNGYSEIHAVLFFAILDSINKNRWKSTSISYDNLINKSGNPGKRRYLAGREWLIENNIIEMKAGKNGYQMASYFLHIQVQKCTAIDTGNYATTAPLYAPLTAPINNKHKTNKPLKDKHKTIELNISFENFYDLYDKKRGSIEKLKNAWLSLTNEERQLAMDHIPKYKLSQPDKQYRKDPATYLNNKSFNDEIITKNEQTHGNNTGKHYTNKQAGTCLAADRFFGGLAELADQ